MKIIRLSTVLNFGGLEKRLVTVSRIQDEHEWIFCAIGSGGDAAEHINQNGKRVILLNTSYTIPSIKAFFRLIQLFRREKPDVVHTSGAEANFHGVLAARIAGVKRIIAEEIGIPNHRPYHKLAFRLIYQIPDVVIGNSIPVLDYLLKENGVKGRKIKLIANPVLPPDRLTRQNESGGGPFVLLTVSRLKAVKNIEGVFRAISRLSKEGMDMRFYVFGDGDHRKRLEEEIKDLRLEHLIFLKGYSTNPWQDITPHLFVLNSISEGFSNALAEAMALGIPCLSTHVGSADQLIANEESGWLVHPGDEEALYQKLKGIILLNRNTIIEVGRKGSEAVNGKFSLAQHHQQLLEIYQP